MTPLDEDSIIATRMLDGIKPDGQKTRIVQAAIIGEPPNRTDDAMERAMDGRFAAARKFSTSFGSISAGQLAVSRLNRREIDGTFSAYDSYRIDCNWNSRRDLAFDCHRIDC